MAWLDHLARQNLQSAMSWPLSPSDVSTQVCNNVHVSIHGRTPLYMSATISRSRCNRVPGNVSRHTGEQPQLCHAGTLQLLTDYSLRLYLFLVPSHPTMAQSHTQMMALHKHMALLDVSRGANLSFWDRLVSTKSIREH